MPINQRTDFVLRAARVVTLTLAVLAGLVYGVNGKDSGIVGSNNVRPFAFVVKLKSGQELCQSLGMWSRRPTAVLVTLGVDGAGPQPLRTRVTGQQSVRVVRRYRDGVVSFKIPAVPAKIGKFCITNRGSSPVSLAGEAVAGARVDRIVMPFSVSLILVSERHRWRNQVAEVLRGVGRGRGEISGWLVVAGIGLLTLGAIVLTAGATWRFTQ